MGLQGQVAVVTGAAAGLGRAMAIELAERGAKVAIVDRDGGGAEETAELIRGAGEVAEWVECDITEPLAVERCAATVAERIGPADVLVNNAGALRSAPLIDLPFEDWSLVVSVNLHGTFLCSQAFGKQMLDRGSGAIVNIASIAGVMAASGRGAYSATKSAIIALTRQAALEWSERGVRVNAVCPGMIESGMGGNNTTDGKLELVPAGRFGTAADVAKLVAFLAGPDADYITGEAVVVDGGLSQSIMRELIRR